jgi:hypothetical protein
LQDALALGNPSYVPLSVQGAGTAVKTAERDRPSFRYEESRQLE